MGFFKKIFTVLLATILVQSVFSQSISNSKDAGDIFIKIQEKQINQGDVMVFQDMRINELLYNHVEQNKRKEGVPGFRIRIFSDLGSTARVQSQDAQAKFLGLFPEIQPHREYVSPYYRVVVGDYRTKIDALKDFKRIKRYFPSAFIVPDNINYPNLEE